MNNQEFIGAFERAVLPGFSHRDHIRMAWIYLRRDGPVQGQESIRRGLQHFASSIGVPQKYHDTITIFWACLVQHAIENTSDPNNFEALVSLHPYLLNASSLFAHYSRELIASPQARQIWIAPDLQPLPETLA